MAGRKNHGNNSKRFDVNSFYAYIKKAHVSELLDKDGNTPFDSDSIDNSVWEYAAYIYKDIQDYGGRLSYHDSESFRSDSDGSGSNNWSAISRTAAISQVYKPLRRWLYSLDSDEGINASEDQISSGFNRKYYTVPLTDSEGTLRHVNIYTFLKSHFDRWMRFDPYERRKIASRVADNLDEDSDVRYRYADNVIIAMEEDSDLSRRVVELVSNVLQTDSEVRNEILKTTIKALQNDSDAARDLARIIGNVLETDSDVRNEYADSVLASIRQDSDQQVELGLILSSHEFTEISAATIYTRKVMPMDSDDTGSIGDSDNRFALGNFATVLTDDLKVRSLEKDRVVFVGDSEGRLATTSKLQWQGDSELVIDANLNVTNDTKLSTVKVTDLAKERIVFVSDSEGRLSTSSNLQWQGDSELLVTRLNVTLDSKLASARVSNLAKDRIVYSSDSEGRLATDTRLRFEDGTLIYDDVHMLAIDSDKFVRLLIENIDSEFRQFVGLDSEAVEKIIGQSTVLSQVAVPVGPLGNIYYIDSDNTNILTNDALVTVGSGNESTFKASLQKGRMGHNTDTKKTFYNDGSTVHEIGTARTFTDVVVIEQLASPPDSDVLGIEGLRPGTIAVADGVNWDPAGFAGATPYPVFWDGGQWLIFSLF